MQQDSQEHVEHDHLADLLDTLFVTPLDYCLVPKSFANGAVLDQGPLLRGIGIEPHIPVRLFTIHLRLRLLFFSATTLIVPSLVPRRRLRRSQ
jgi:hypothetical protein